MKNIFSIVLLGSLLLSSVSCDDFLTEVPTTSIPTEEAFTSSRDYEVALHGLYKTMGEAEFLGRNALALNDVASDLSDHSVATSHFYNVFMYQILETNTYLEEIWSYGYKVIDRSARIIDAAEKATGFSEKDMAIINQCVAQAYAAKALSEFILTNYYGLPYSEANKLTPGIVNVTKPVEPFQKISRASVEANYELILSDINKAKTFYEKEGVSNPEHFYLNKAAVSALEARVKLYKKDYVGTILAASEAITLRGGNIVSTPEAFQQLFYRLDISTEDIFVLAKTEADNLSSTSINTLYKDYGVSINKSTIAEYAESDIRLSVMGVGGGKYSGVLQNGGHLDVQNIPVFRLPEVYLNLAEAYAMLGEYNKAKENLLAVAAKRNPALDAETIKEDASILPVIIKERKLELAQEGHRFFDARRLAIKIDVANAARTNFDVAKFVYPVPAKEINSAAGVQQTPDWDKNLPK